MRLSGAMYGLSPAVFVQRAPSDNRTYEEIEVSWLLAVWPSYMDRIVSKPSGSVYALTQQGRPTGWLLIGEDTVYPRPSLSDELSDILVAEVTAEIDRDILQTIKLSCESSSSLGKSTERFVGTSILKPSPRIAGSTIENRLHSIGIVVPNSKEVMLRASWTNP